MIANLPVTSPSARQATPNRFPPWPMWIGSLLEGAGERRFEDDAVSLLVRETAHNRFIRARVAQAVQRSPDEFRFDVGSAYAAIARLCSAGDVRFPVRFWNYIPSIHQPSGAGIDRYMVFNIGRHDAWRGSFESLCPLPHLPTATAVGHDGPDLIIDALAAASAGKAVENPRQIPSYRYTRRYGPKPPCFSRATILDGNPQSILIGGTASVVGEDSRHPHDLRRQIRETLLNLRGLICSVFDVADSPALLRNFAELRVYFPRPGDETIIRDAVAAAFPAVPAPELFRAELCRRELLVEIEGVVGILPKEAHAAASDRPVDRTLDPHSGRSGFAPDRNGPDVHLGGA